MTFYFYDLETSGLNPRESRIMQFAGQRTDMNLQPIGQPHNILIALTPDTVPDPYAILVTGITPQKTIEEGITEDEFLKIFRQEIATEGTIFMGYNTVRFDDEFVRYLHYRNLYDPYEWQYQNGRSRWDLLDVVRMMRALRPEGMVWPNDKDGKATNRLELLAAANKLTHSNAHDALSDVQATIDLASKIKQLQPKLFSFLLQMRDKQKIADLVGKNEPFIYTSGKYDSAFQKTTVAVKLTEHPQRNGALVYDLRYDPTPFVSMADKALVKAWLVGRDSPEPKLPVKSLLYNRCPAVAPLSVLDEASQQRLKLDIKIIDQHRKVLQDHPEFAENVLKALAILDKQQETKYRQTSNSVDGQLYDGFIEGDDKRLLSKVHLLPVDELTLSNLNFKDSRLRQLLPLFKARNYPRALTGAELERWRHHCRQSLLAGGENSRLARYFAQLAELNKRATSKDNQFTLEELKLYGESLLPDDET